MLNIYLCVFTTYTVAKTIVIIQVSSKTLSIF
jgi:hypothetical protein